MQDPALPWRHGVETEWQGGFAHALGCDLRGELQFSQSTRAVVAAIESHPIVKPRIQAQPAHCDVFECLEQFGAPLKKQVAIRALESHDDIRSFKFLATRRFEPFDAISQIKPSRA